MAKPPPTPEELKKRVVEDDPIDPDQPIGGADESAISAADVGTSAVNAGFDVPGSPAVDDLPPQARSVLEQADRILAAAHARTHTQPGVDASRRPDVTPASRKFADETYAPDMLEQTSEPVLDMMVSNVVALAQVEPINPNNFREFRAGESIRIGSRLDPLTGEEVDILKTEGQLAYEQFMNDPVVIRIHTTKDKNESPVVFIGVNGDSRWLPRNRALRLQRKFVERLAQAQEMSFATKEDKDPNVDIAMKIVRSTAASYEFSVLEEVTQAGQAIGRRWLARQVRSSS